MRRLFIDGVQVFKGMTVKTFKGEPCTVTGWTEPHKPSSTGRIYVRFPDDDMDHVFFPSVVNAEWGDAQKDIGPTTTIVLELADESCDTFDKVKDVIKEIFGDDDEDYAIRVLHNTLVLEIEGTLDPDHKGDIIAALEQELINLDIDYHAIGDPED